MNNFWQFKTGSSKYNQRVVQFISGRITYQWFYDNKSNDDHEC